MRMYLKVSPEQINVFNHTKGINTTGFFFFSKTQDVNLTFKMRRKKRNYLQNGGSDIF